MSLKLSVWAYLRIAPTDLMQPSSAPWKLTALLYSIFAILTQAHPSSLNTTLSAELNPQCTNSIAWMKNGYFSPNDCLLALEKLEDTDFKIYKTRNIEFLAPGAVPKTKLPAVRLPRRYEAGSCSIVIAMLITITEDFLPGQERQVDEYAATDVSKFSYLWSIAGWIDGTCVSKASRLGWCATGMRSSIGVFAVGTDSKANGLIPGRALVGNMDPSASVDAS
ncbi:MAG: hypothetical protein Q9169_001658 [Polycauliona sp. 2 TL-2023]